MQDAPPRPRPLPLTRPPWHAILVPLVERRYKKVEAMRFKARDESGVDWFGSDEVRVGTADAEGFTSSGENLHKSIDSTNSSGRCISVRPGFVSLGFAILVGEALPPSAR